MKKDERDSKKAKFDKAVAAFKAEEFPSLTACAMWLLVSTEPPLASLSSLGRHMSGVVRSALSSLKKRSVKLLTMPRLELSLELASVLSSSAL